tara:strand:+ start:1424 stop:1708 length:285 start_codon:yes stop_codon:yes gene_type:complete
MNRKISTKEVPAELVHQSGPNKGNLNQDRLQIKGIEMKCGMIHPLCSNVIYVQTNRATGKQQWTTIDRNAWRKMRNGYNSLSYYHKNKNKKASK